MKIVTLILLARIDLFVWECAVTLHQIATHSGVCFIKFGTWLKMGKSTAKGIRTVVDTTKNLGGEKNEDTI